MLKMALFDCAINENYCSVDGGRGICPLFSSPSRGIWQLKSPHPREFAIQGKKMLKPDWCIKHEFLCHVQSAETYSDVYKSRGFG